MKPMKYILILYILITLFFSGCYSATHQGYKSFMDDSIGSKTIVAFHKFPNTGELIRADYLIAGKGVTAIEKDENGNMVIHWDIEEILPTHPIKESVGKCLIYEVVDPKTHILKAWGYDEGGNPLSCRFWP